MKKIHSLATILMLALSSLALTSCDNDDAIADTLWGVWKGNMYVTGEYDGRVYYSSYSTIGFDKDPYDYASGSGYWIDEFSNAPWDYYATHIEWQVNNSDIIIHSLEDDTYFTIHNYSLSGNYFSGEIWSEDGSRQAFRLVKTSSPDWNDYDWGWDWNDGYGYYSPARQSEDVTTGRRAAPSKPVRRIGVITAGN